MVAPPPVPALPDTARETAFVIAAATGPYNVGFALYGDGTDYGQWADVWLDGNKLTPGTDWMLSSPSGSLSTLARPITDAQITLTTARTGTLRIVGARRPRRLAQFNEGRGVTSRDDNQTYTDIVAMLRETWDRFARVLQAPPGETLSILVPASLRANLTAIFDSQGNLTAGAPLGNGTVSAAMQGVINAATLALGRTALGVGIGGGLEADGLGNIRVAMPVVPLGVNTSILPSHHRNQIIATAGITLTLGSSSDYFNGFNFSVRAAGGAVVLNLSNVANSFRGQAAGAQYTIPAGAVIDISTDAAGTFDIKPPNQQLIDNPVINGNFELWQRGTTFNNPANLARLADRWNVAYNGTIGTCAITRADLQPISGLIPGYPKYAIRVNQSLAGAGNTFFDISTQIEDVNTLSGRKITISAWVFFQFANNLLIKTEQFFGGGGGGSASAFNTSAAIAIPGASWTRVSYTCDIANIIGKTRGANGDDSLNIIFSLPPNVVNDMWITAVRVDDGPVSFDFAPRAPGSDRSLGERYFQKSYDVTTDPGVATYSGAFAGRPSNAAGPFYVPFRRPMRGHPFIRLYNPQTGALGTWRDTSANADVGVSAVDVGESGFTVNIVSGGVAGNIVRGQWTADGEF